MHKLSDYLAKHWLFFVMLLLTIPAFYRMLPFGMYSTQDFHLFRLIEFDKCIRSFQIPCVWAPDAGLGYGEPVFNFYGQFAYLIGEIYHLLGGSFINSIKFTFIFSFASSALAMYILAKKIWRNSYSAIIASTLYLYAPYRSVDVWVRGALPEAFSFTIFPLIILAIEEKSVKWLSLLIALLILTHNLSFVMFAPLLVVWLIFRKFWKGFYALLIAGLLSSFYILPVIFESKFIDIQSTITGYFDFHNHFATLFELFLSNFWGYGASLWGPRDDLSFAIGYLQWSIPVLILIYLFFKKKLFTYTEFLVLFFMGLGYVYLTHNKSTVIWEILPFLSYIQFPWRLLGVIVFCSSLASGLLIIVIKKNPPLTAAIICSLAIMLNISFFRHDIWYKVNDSYYFTGVEWDRQRTASIGDFWPKFGHNIPDTPSEGKYINYFPGWESITPPENGLIPLEGSRFTDTPVRKLGKIVSLVSLISFIGLSINFKKWKKEI